jgi:hypothetical protein
MPRVTAELACDRTTSTSLPIFLDNDSAVATCWFETVSTGSLSATAAPASKLAWSKGSGASLPIRARPAKTGMLEVLSARFVSVVDRSCSSASSTVARPANSRSPARSSGATPSSLNTVWLPAGPSARKSL